MSKLLGNCGYRIWKEMELIPVEAIKKLKPDNISLHQLFEWSSLDIELRNLELMASASCDGFEQTIKRDYLYNIARIIVSIGEEAADNVGSDYHGLIVLRSNGILVPTFNLYRSKGL